jgi:hypothetical protein
MGSAETDGLLPVFLGWFLADDRSGTRGLPRDDLNAGGITERLEVFLATLPGQTKGAHVGHAKMGDNITDAVTVLRCKISTHYCAFGPIHKLGQRDATVKICTDFISDYFASDGHDNRVFRCRR